MFWLHKYIQINILKILTNIFDEEQGTMQGQSSIPRSNMIFQKIRVVTSVIPLFHVILTGESISYIILMIQGHSQGQRSNRRLNKRKYDF